MKKITLIITALACIVSCIKKEESQGPMEITFSASDSFSADVITKADAVTAISKFYATATTGTSGSESLLWNNKEFNKAANENIYSSDGVYWPGTQQAMHFYASTLTPTFSGGNITVAATTENDVLCAYNETPTWKQTNQLTFEHIFARLGLCTITAPAGYTGSNLSVTVKPKVSGNYNLRTGAWSGTVNASGDVTITTSFDGGGSVNDIYLVPGRYTIKASYTLSKGTYSQDFSRSASVEVQPGKINLITATLPEGEATDLLFSVTVSPWTNCTLTPSF